MTTDNFARKFYARIKKARNMSYEDALKTLGFGPSDHPNDLEVTKAYKSLALKAHPDAGGSHEAMVELNIAKEILDGKTRPTYQRAPAEEYAYTPYKRPEPPKQDVVTFEQAKSKAGLPSSVEWVFMTDTQRASNNYNGDESSKSNRGWVVYGRTADSHVFVGVENSYYSGLAGANDGGYDYWSIKSNEYSLSTKLTPSWLSGCIAKAISEMKWFGGRFNNKVVEIKGRDPLKDKNTLAGAATSGKGTSLKNILVNMGEISGDDPSVANRKIPVELKVAQDYGFDNKVTPGFYPEPSTPNNTWDGKYHGYYYKIELNIAGRDYALDEADTKKLLGLKLGGDKRLLAIILGDYWDRGGKKVLTRMPKGKIILEGLLQFLKSLPAPAVELLQRAAEQMKG